jgi:acetyl-CoA acetyltransferase
MYIIGSSQTKFGNSEAGFDEMMYEVIEGSLSDAFLEPHDIEAFGRSYRTP